MKKLILIVLSLAAGCGPNPNQARQAPSTPQPAHINPDTRLGVIEPDLKAKARLLKPPAPPPTVPPKRDIALDPALRESARKELLAANKSNDPVLRANSIEAMQDTLREKAAPEITAGLADTDALVRFAACMAVGKLKLASTYATLVKLADDPDDNVKIGARYALHRLGDKRRTDELEKFAQNGFPSVRGNVAIVLGLLEEPTALKVLSGMANDSEATVRLQAFEAMWRLGSKDGLDELVAGTLSSFPDDQIVCVLALAQTHDLRVRPHVFGKLTSEYPEIALVAARAMGMLGLDDGYGVALKGVKSTDPRLKAMGAMAFGQIGRADAQEYLSPLLKDQNPSVRLAAATAILQLKA